MADFAPQIGETIRIGSMDYQFTRNEAATGLSIIYAATGGKGTVYRLRASNGSLHALKVFKEKWRSQRIGVQTAALGYIYKNVHGVDVVNRIVLDKQSHSALIEQFPDLAFAVLMPWITGDVWQNYWNARDSKTLTPADGLYLAQRFSSIIRKIEESNAAHCDLAGSNVMIDLEQRQVQLIDIEDSYIVGFKDPDEKVAGADGYYHRTSRKSGQWSEFGDRFSSAIMLAELLAWPNEEVRAANEDGESYFDDEDLDRPSFTNPKYKVLQDVLKHSSPNVFQLFKAAWQAPTLQECPSIISWYEAIKGAKPAVIVPDILATPIVRLGHESVTWDKVPSATYYDVIVLLSGEEFTQTYRITQCSFVVSSQLQKISVQAGQGKRISKWSRPLVIGAAEPPVITVSEWSDGLGKDITWSAVAGATEYTRGVSNRSLRASTRSAKFESASKTPGYYRFSVVAHVQFEGEEFTSSASVDIPVLPQVPQWNQSLVKAFFDQVTLSWQTGQTTKSHVYYKGVKDARDVKLETTRHELSLSLKPDTYTFQVAAVYEGIESARSPEVTLRVEHPALEWTIPPRVAGSHASFSWNDVLQSSSEISLYQYRLVVDDVASITSGDFHEMELVPGEHVAQVQLVDSSGVVLTETDKATFYIALGKIAFTSDKSINFYDNDELEWEAVPRATHYQLNFYGSEHNLLSRPKGYKCKHPSKSIGAIVGKPGEYLFTVSACYNDFTDEESGRFKVVVSSISSPRLKADTLAVHFNEDARLVWGKTKQSEQFIYEVQWTTTLDFDDGIRSLKTDERAIIVDTSQSGTLYYRVRAVKGQSTSSWVNAIVQVILPAPEIIEVVPSGKGSYIAWGAVGDTSSYRVEHCHKPSFPPDQTILLEVATNNVDVGWTSGYVRIQANEGDYCEPFELPTAPVLSAPVWRFESFTADEHNNAVVTWQSDIKLYNPKFVIQLAEEQSGTEVQNLIVHEPLAKVHLEHFGIYTAKVCVLRGTQTGEWSSAATVACLPTGPQDLRLKETTRGIKAEWSSIDDAIQYEVEWSTSKVFAQSAETRGILTTETNYVALFIHSTKVYMRVRAILQDTSTNWSRPSAITTEEKLLPKPALHISRVLIAPALTLRQYAYLFECDAVSGAVSYRLEYLLSDSSNTWSVEHTWSDSNLPVTFDLPLGEFTFRVVASEGSLETEVMSEVVNVIVEHDSPSLTIEVDGKLVSFTWLTVVGATEYCLHVRQVGSAKWLEKLLPATNEDTQSFAGEMRNSGEYESYVVGLNGEMEVELVPFSTSRFSVA